MNKEFWLGRYTALKKNGVVGSMSYGDEFQERVDVFFQEIKRFLKITKCNTIVDYGCGTAKYAKLLTEHFKAKKYIGLDIIDFVIEDNIKKLPGYEFKLMGGVIPKSDVIFMASLFQHLNDNEVVSALKKMKTALNKGGKIFIVDLVSNAKNDSYTYFRDMGKHSKLIQESGLKPKLLYMTTQEVALIQCTV